MTSVRRGTVISRSSTVNVTVSPGALSALKRAPLPRDVLAVLIGEELDGGRDRGRREVAERAERAAEDVPGDVGHRREVLFASLSPLEARECLREPERPLAARRALATGLVLVEAGEA